MTTNDHRNLTTTGDKPMTIAEQVATLEHDLAAALAKIDELNSANAAFDSANASLRREHVALQLEVNDMKHYVDDTRTMAEQLAESALKMLRASRRHVGAAPAEVIPFAKPETFNIDRGPSPYWKNASLDEKVATLPEKWPDVSSANFLAKQAEIVEALEADGEKLRQMTGEDHGPYFLPVPTPLAPNKFDPLPIFLQDPPVGDSPRPIFG